MWITFSVQYATAAISGCLLDLTIWSGYRFLPIRQTTRTACRRLLKAFLNIICRTVILALSSKTEWAVNSPAGHVVAAIAFGTHQTWPKGQRHCAIQLWVVLPVREGVYKKSLSGWAGLSTIWIGLTCRILNLCCPNFWKKLCWSKAGHIVGH